MKRIHTTLAASVATLLLAAPTLAQTDQQGTGATPGQATTEPQMQDGGASAGTGADAGAQAGTGDGQTSAEAGAGDEMQGQTGRADAASGSQGGTGDMQAEPGSMASQPEPPVVTDEDVSRTVVLDIEGFSQNIYERGFRQGYIRGIADARERFMMEMRRMNQERRSATAQRQRGAMTGRDGQRPVAPDGGSAEGERGSIIVLPPGISPEAFIERLAEMNEGGGSGDAQ